MTGVDAYIDNAQVRAREVRPTQDLPAAVDSFKRAAAVRIRSFLEDHRLSLELADQISYTIETLEEEMKINVYGPQSLSPELPELPELLGELGNQLLALASRRGICEVSYSPPQPPELDEEGYYAGTDTRPPVARQERENPPRSEADFELLLNDDATLEVQTPPTPAPVDEATRTPIPAEKEPREQSIVMNFDGQGTTQTIALPDGRILTIHVAPGIEIVGPEPDGSPTMTFE